jgi:hypothetical protein
LSSSCDTAGGAVGGGGGAELEGLVLALLGLVIWFISKDSIDFKGTLGDLEPTGFEVGLLRNVLDH